MIKFKMRWVSIVVVTGIVAAGIFDLILVAFYPDANMSISRFLADAGIRAPGVVFTFGFVCGHLFGYMKPVAFEKLPIEGGECYTSKQDKPKRKFFGGKN